MAATDRTQAHELIDRLDDGQVPTVVALLQFLLADPVSRALACAPVDDEPETEEERRAVEESRRWLAEHGGKGIPHEEILAEFGIRREDLE